MMRLKYKNTLLLFTVGLLSILLMTSYFFNSQKNREIINIKNNQNFRVNDMMSHLKKEITHDIQIVQSFSQSQMMLEFLQLSNNEYDSFSKDGLIVELDEINTNWINASYNSQVVQDILSNPLALSFKKQQVLFQDNIGEIFLTNKYGVAIASTKKLTTRIHSHKYWWKAIENASFREVFVDDRGFDESVEGYVLGIVSPIFDENELVGILKVNFRIEKLLDEIVNQQRIPNRDTMVIRSGGKIVKEHQFTPLSTNISDDILAKVISQEGESFFDSENNQFITSFKLDLDDRFKFGGSPFSIDHNEGNNGEYWLIVEQYDADSAMSLFYSDLKDILKFSFILLLVLSLIIFVLSHYMIEPIKGMVRTLTKIGSGDLALRLDVHESGELGSLSKSFNDMMDQLSLTTASKLELERESQRRKVEEEKYSHLFNSMTEGFATHEILLDEKGEPFDYRFKTVNPAYEKILGIKASEIIDKTILEVFPDTEPFWIEKFGDVALTGKSIRFEHYFKSLNCYYSISAFSAVLGEFAVSFTDITARVKAEKEFEEKNEVLSLTLKSIADGVITTDTKGNITFLNTIAEELTGWTNEDAFGKTVDAVFNIVRDDSNERCENQVTEVLKSGQIHEIDGQISLISKNKEIYSIEDSAAPIITQSGQIMGVIIVFRNVSEKLKLRDSINNNQKLESLGILAGRIAHDFNNYLTGINGYVELVKIRLEKEDSEKNVNYLNKVLTISDRAKNLTHKFLTFSKGGNTSREIIHMQDLIYSSISSISTAAKIVPHLLIEKDLWACNCNKNRIIQCIDNLIQNSIESMPNGGSLTITAKNSNNTPFQIKEGNYIEIKITDTGSGIPLDIRDKIFDPFFSSRVDGNGLGLSTVYSIIKNHDGLIQLEPQIEIGTTFSFYLPAAITSLENGVS